MRAAQWLGGEPEAGATVRFRSGASYPAGSLAELVAVVGARAAVRTGHDEIEWVSTSEIETVEEAW